MIDRKNSTIKLVNETTTKTAPKGAMGKMRHVLDRNIHTYAEATEDKVIFAAKEDVEDGFW